MTVHPLRAMLLTSIPRDRVLLCKKHSGGPTHSSGTTCVEKASTEETTIALTRRTS